MLRWGWGGLAVVVLSATGYCANLVDVDRSVDPYSAVTLTQAVDQHKKMKVLAIGRGKIGYGGIYVYDPHGNCVSWDDARLAGAEDDLAVEFVAAQTGSYTIEVRNLGQETNPFHIAIK